MERVGVVAELFRFPVKSMQAEPVEVAALYWYGLEGDRRYAFVRAGDHTNFPWLTAREVPEMLRFRPYFVDPAVARQCPVRVVTPDGLDLPVESDDLRALLEMRHRAPVSLLHVNRGSPDAAAVSVIGQSTVEDLGRRLDMPLDTRRFRQNIVIRPDSGEPGAEDRWCGQLLAFGSAEGAAIRLNRPDGRCMMVNLDAETATQQPAVLREIARNRDNVLGMYCSVERLGTIRVGDPVLLG